MARKKRSYPKRDVSEVAQRILLAEETGDVKAVLVYGRTGVGKTRLCGSASELGKTLVIACEPGTLSIKKLYPKVGVYKMTQFQEIDEIYWYLMNAKHGYKFVCVDPLSALQKLCMAHVLQEKADIDLAADPDMPDRQDWGKCAELMRTVITRYRDIPGVITIFTAQERRRENDDDEVDSDYVIGPEIQPAVKNYLCGAVDIVGRLYVRDIEEGDKSITERRLLVVPYQGYDAKDRTDSLGRIVRRPTMPSIFKKAGIRVG